ncbi:hypothetical protein NC653_010520 [Populus alba x Populus x berolinensis]|uniref:Uncharacterized protein n=1 Tax=Populus alba x Populus x berolinensis TaxID=444605 RepID=A0AAD6W5V8_9ROSI|nr:hypothetical protein NC653_010520 [Populus alba x Populus x berolinensis]
MTKLPLSIYNGTSSSLFRYPLPPWHRRPACLLNNGLNLVAINAHKNSQLSRRFLVHSKPPFLSGLCLSDCLNYTIEYESKVFNQWHRFSQGEYFARRAAALMGRRLDECNEICYKDPVLKDRQWTAYIDRSPGSASYSEECFKACKAGCGYKFEIHPGEVDKARPNRPCNPPPSEKPPPVQKRPPQAVKHGEPTEDVPCTSA